jgi:hypothetical protein
MNVRWPGWIAIGGMLAVVPLAGWLFLIGRLTAAGVFENLGPEEQARGERLAAQAALAALGALTTVVGLAFRFRVVAGVGAIAVLGSATAVAVDWHLSAARVEPLAVFAFVPVVAVALLALWAALREAEH